ncbi:MAG: DUF3667 domain-containing protein [Bacteroidota bacterium]
MRNTNNDKTNKFCPNCGYHFLTIGGFCANCGQKYEVGKPTVWSLIKDFFSSILNLESRIWQTLLALFVPGKLTKAFFQGKKQHYVSPLRLFSVTGIAFFAVLNIWGDDFVKSNISDEIRATTRNNYFASFMEELQQNSDSLKLSLSNLPDAPYVLDSLYRQMRQDNRDSLQMGVDLSPILSGESTIDDVESILVAKKDIAGMPIDSLIYHYAGDRHYIEKLILRQNIRFQRDGEDFVGYLISKLIWMMLIMMPLLAMVLKLIYIRRSYYYVEHLVFSFHTHAFFFVIATLLLILSGSVELVSISETARTNLHFDFLVKVSLIAIPIYFFLALLRVYQQLKWKTFFKFIILNVCYLVLFILGSIFTFAITALLF